jgi:thiol-disulfide isomerase/thioredoxin
MKKISIVIIFLAFIVSNTFSQEKNVSAGGMSFFEGSWNEVLAAAKTQNKYIFVDSFADWCGPCKWMVKNVFNTEAAGNFYNENFIMYAFDMEKGEGVDFAKKYDVRVYPTYLYFSPDGEIVHRSVGSKPVEKFIEDGKNALDPSKQFLSMQKKYEQGERSESFLYDYVHALANANQKEDVISEVANAYLGDQKQEDLTNEKNWEVIQLLSDVNSPVFKYLEQNRDKFAAKFGNANVDMKISFTKMQDCEKNGNWDEYAKVTAGFVDKYAMADAGMLNNFAWKFYEKINDKNMLKKAEKWAKKSVELEKQYANTDTYASILYKVGKYEKALKFINEAIELAKNSNEDYSGSLEMKKKIEKKLEE